jgi:hypothetical protein
MDLQNEKCVMVMDESLPFTTPQRLSNKIMFPQITRRARCKICDMILLKLTMEISKSNFVAVQSDTPCPQRDAIHDQAVAEKQPGIPWAEGTKQC